MKPLLFALYVVFVFGGLSAQTPAWQPSPGHSGDVAGDDRNESGLNLCVEEVS